ncbi:MAG: hypothetical protein KME25_04295 [Symplocastrum torsivum CPER-KK1]|jgi:phosphoenolpyruvate-protein kinase (PTS system EI component)|uniref:Uncharacterized protein n=1 Tax=Symplocastrum torsivum CPER-KK1 TaxID=450513 RepID=A0A951U7X6_9CYAN|nr:hypothetical protein [Microcoleus sp. FACHB-SPT15]MBD1809646.1 hypothetical protein [Microcoleus sp. FACHB-SPT15]MBW4543658.1 hypothetical protein [Symplocastrum torsivum CPER-KK1]
MNPPAIPAVKVGISRLTMSEAKAIAYEVLQLPSALEVKDYIAAWLSQRTREHQG